MSDRQKLTPKVATLAMERLAADNAGAATQSVALLPEGYPAKIGKYPIKALLGHGGMAAVLLGEHPELKVPVAIKVIAPKIAADPAYVGRFLKEARLAMCLDHPNLVRVFDAGQEGGASYMVMEYVEGGTVAGRLGSHPEGRLPVAEALGLVRGVAAGLSAAEAKGVVHRDVKPANILLTRDGRPKLADLGLAKHAAAPGSDPDSDPSVTMPGALIGTPSYMAPEQVRDSGRADTRADIYALGVTLYELLTGELPFRGANSREVLAKHLTEDVPDPAGLNPAVPREVASLVRKMTAREIEARFQTAAALVEAMDGLGQSWWQRHSMALAAAACLLLAAGIGLAVPRLRSVTGGQLASAEALLAVGRSAEALPLFQALQRQHPKDVRVLYGLGLCCLEKRDHAAVAGMAAALDPLDGGAEFAEHLRVLDLIDQGELDQALALVDSWLGKARYRLPFLHAKGLILLRRQELSEAEASLGQAVTQASLFDFQRLEAVDALARLFSATGRYAQAAEVYGKALASRSSAAGGVPATVHTNHAVTLMNAGRAGEASQPLKLALALEPGNELATYLQAKLSEQKDSAQAEAVKRTVAMIEEIGAAVAKARTAATGPADTWTSRPVVLVFPAPENRTPWAGRLGEDQRWVDRLTTAVQARSRFPVVERARLEEILREHQMSSSDLVSAEGRLRLGTVLPASILVVSSFAAEPAPELTLRLVDVATTEVLDTQTVAAAGAGGEALAAAAAELETRLLTTRAIRGLVTSVEGGVCQLNLGRYHGLVEGDVLALYPASASGTSPLRLERQSPAATVTVTKLDRFEALVEPPAGSTVTPGMLAVLQRKG